MAFAPDYAQQRALLRRLHRQRRRQRASSSTTRATADRADPGSARAAALPAPARAQPQRRPAAVRARQAALHRLRRRRRRRRPARPARQRAEPRRRCSARSCASIRARRAAGPYSDPAPNPFVDRSGARAEIYAYGLRNPWRFSFDRATGDLTIGDVGQDEVEEIDFVRRGQGAGRELRLARVRGPLPLHAGRVGARRGHAGDHRAPHRTATARSPAASSSATRALPAWRGRYVFGDFCRGVIQTARLRAGAARDVRRPRAQGRRSCPRSARTRAAGSTRRRWTARSTGSCRKCELADLGVACVRAPNPSPLTLAGTNTWLLGRDPAWVVDPGPAIDAHLDAVAGAAEARGGAGGHRADPRHSDHAEALDALRERLGGLPWRVRGRRTCAGRRRRVRTARVLHVPGHARRPPRVRRRRRCLHRRRGARRGQRVRLRRGCASYLDGLRRLRALDARGDLPGPRRRRCGTRGAKLDEYLAHRAERERKLLAALDGGARSEDELLDAAWDDAPAAAAPVRRRSRCARTWRSCATRAGCRTGSRSRRSRPGGEV